MNPNVLSHLIPPLHFKSGQDFPFPLQFTFKLNN